jgi:hypothetical protein
MNMVTMTSNTLELKAPFNTLLLVLILSLSLVGCGGGGGGGGSNSSASQTSQPITDTAEQDEETTEEDVAEEITQEESPISTPNIAPEFDLRSVDSIQLTVDISDQTTDKSFLSVCHFKEGSDDIDYENCIVRTVVQAGQYSGEFKAPAHFDELAVAIWFYDTSINPIEDLVTQEDLASGAVEIN